MEELESSGLLGEEEDPTAVNNSEEEAVPVAEGTYRWTCAPGKGAHLLPGFVQDKSKNKFRNLACAWIPPQKAGGDISLHAGRPGEPGHASFSGGFFVIVLFGC